MYKLEILIFSNGERFPVLINKETGIPDFYSSLWITVGLRNHSAVNTIQNKLHVIQWLMEWEKNNNLTLSKMLKNRELLTHAE